MNKTNCTGCEENFYNGNNPFGITECFHLKHATITMRFAISVNAPMDTRANYIQERRPVCFRRKGSVYLNAIPEYAQ